MPPIKANSTRPCLIIASGHLVAKDGKLFLNGKNYADVIAKWFHRENIGQVRTFVEVLKAPIDNPNLCNCEISRPLGTWRCPVHGKMRAGLMR